MFSYADMVIHRIAGALAFVFDTLVAAVLRLAGKPDDLIRSASYRHAADFFFYDTLKIFLMLTLIIFLVSLVRSYFPPERTRRLLGEGKARGAAGNVFAALLGIVTPFCSCSAVPVFIGFVEAGVPLGVTFSFLIASPMVNEVALVMLWGMFGWKIAALYIVTGISVAILAGVLIGHLRMESHVEDYVYHMKLGTLEEDHPRFTRRLQDAAGYVRDILRKIWPYVIGGIAVGAVMHGWAPEGWLARYAGRDNPLAVFVAVLVGIPLYSNAAGTIPIVSELTRLGMPVGTALAFMMAVTALSLPELIILRKVLKPRLLGVFTGIMGVAIVLTGYLFNFVLP